MNGRLLKIVAGAAISSVVMFGASVKVTLVGTPYGNIGPYQADIGTSTSPTNVICDDDTDSVSIGEYWQANETTLYTLMQDTANTTALSATKFGVDAYSDFQSLDGSNSTNSIKYATDIYEAVGYLVLQLLNNPGSSTIQNAIWSITTDLVSSNAGKEDYATLTGGTGGWSCGTYSTICSALGSSGVGFFNAGSTTAVNEEKQITFLTPVAGTQSSGGSPQEFVMVTPEPSTFALFGAGVIALALGTFRRNKTR